MMMMFDEPLGGAVDRYVTNVHVMDRVYVAVHAYDACCISCEGGGRLMSGKGVCLY